MAITPASRSAPLTLPQVRITRPACTRSRFARQTAVFNASYPMSAPSLVADVEQFLHDAVHVAACPLDAECIVDATIEPVQAVVHGAVCRHWREDRFLHAGHRRH